MSNNIEELGMYKDSDQEKSGTLKEHKEDNLF